MAPLKRGDYVLKPKGYPFHGVVVADFLTMAGEPRLVVEKVESLQPIGLLHIFAPGQLVEWEDS